MVTKELTGLRSRKTRVGWTRRVIAIVVILFYAIIPVAAEQDVQEENVDKAAQSKIVILCGGKEHSQTIDDEEAISLQTDQSVEYTFHISKSGNYTLALRYRPIDEKNTSIKVATMIDGAYPLPAFENLEFPKMWEDDGKARVDGNGNEFAPTQKLAEGYFSVEAIDSSSNYSEPLEIELTEGQHTVKITAVDAPFFLSEIIFSPPEKTLSYDEYLKSYPLNQVYQGEEQVLEGESTALKSSPSLIPLSDNSDPGVSPTDAVKSKLNYIGGSNWNSQSDMITWVLTIPETGFYKLGIWYRQKEVINGNCYRWLKIDGKTPFEEAKQIAFPYSNNWKFLTFSNSENEPYWIWLEKGEREITLSVTLGELDEIKTKLETITQELGDLYVAITMVTGDTVDTYRDYQLFSQIPNFNDTLQRNIDALQSLEERMNTLYQKNSNSYIAQMKNMRLILQKMLDNPYIAHRYKQNYYNTYCGLTASANELGNMPVDIDRFCFGSPNQEFHQKGAGFLQKIIFSVKRFAASFTEDYNNISGTDEKDNIEIWVNWGRDQAQVLNALIQESFTQQSQIGVSVKVTNASIIQAILSGNGPDCSLHLARTEPVNLAMRGGLYDLKQFPDFEEITERFMSNATVPYQYKEGCYALPDTQNFFMLYYRTDIFEEQNLTVPKTWDEFIQVSKKLQRNNLKAYLPYTQISDMYTGKVGVGGLSMFPTLLLQHGQPLYNEDKTGTTLLEAKSIEVFSYWTDFYTELKFDVTMDFYNRFRVGITPMGISSYTLYTTLTDTAPEIEGRWAVAEIPGVKAESGEIVNTVAGSGSGCSILKISEKPKAAWEFLKWWTSAEVQLAYSNNLESLLGTVGRNPTSNVEAFKQMAWDKDSLQQMLSQWKKVEEIPEIPGSYYVSRGIDQAYWNVINKSENPKDMLFKWSQIVDLEIKRKGEQYGFEE